MDRKILLGFLMILIIFGVSFVYTTIDRNDQEKVLKSFSRLYNEQELNSYIISINLHNSYARDLYEVKMSNGKIYLVEGGLARKFTLKTQIIKYQNENSLKILNDGNIEYYDLKYRF
ncbi:MAG: hypothetical protein CVU05_09840 [Bacteroidetes bacterium HGW-Bacteroidetes-21]|nr:MAG: hypothetical protein CVU05_09840 [Bacteroidetes bacterium HGW-Bacteroidetes-21]